VEALERCASVLATVEGGRFQPIVWNMQGDLLRQDKRVEASAEAHRKALAAWSAAAGRNLGQANSLMGLGHCAWQLVRWPEAVRHYKDALAIRRELAPDSMLVADTQLSLATAYSNTGDLDAADRCYQEALALTRRHLPGHPSEAGILNSMGVAASKAGHFGQAQRYFEESLRIKQAQAPDSMSVAFTLNNIASVARLRGDLASSEAYYRQSLKIKQVLEPDSVSLARSYHNMGQIAMARRDYPAAREYLENARRLIERKAPRGREHADCLEQLGNLARLESKFDQAASLYQEVADIRRQVSGDPLDQVMMLINLGINSREEGDLPGAEAHYQAALAICRKTAPASLYTARALLGLGETCLRGGELDRAEPLLAEALQIIVRAAPRSINEAVAQHDMGDLRRRQDRPREALTHYERAVAALEGQLERLGGSREVAEDFAAEYAGYYKDLLELKLLLDDPRGAFDVLERYRARSLLAMLAERDLDFSRDVPPELLSQYETCRLQCRQTYEQLMAVAPDREPARLTELQGRLAAQRLEESQVWQEIRRASPRLATLQAPEPLTLDQAAAALERDTLLLSFVVHERATHLFALLDGRLRVESLPVGRQQVRELTEYFLAQLSNPASRPARLRGRAHALYQQLLGPVDDMVRRSTRILVCPDGPLHMLPFAALGLTTARYLVEEKPVSYAISATVFDAGRRAGGPGRSGRRVVLFGDPVYPGKMTEGTATRPFQWILRDGAIPPLPASRGEVEGIAALYPGTQITYLGSAATEARATALDRQARYVHFACHGFFNHADPLDSGLLLSIPESTGGPGDDGFLQVWEVFEKVRLDAEQVTLSACETARGKDLGGEGLTGLNRAFQYAGARTVMSTLWSVADASTAEFQKRYYRHLRSGQTKTEAARLAQREFIGGKVRLVVKAPTGEPPDLSHPYYWAGFVLNGQWR
jgi:CHAT domain-containing protein/Tfp pilus assembly protein PilF